MRNFQTKVVEKKKTHILYSITFFPENRAYHEIMWKCVTAGQAIRIARYILKSTSTHSEYEIFIALTGTMFARRHFNGT